MVQEVAPTFPTNFETALSAHGRSGSCWPVSGM